MKRETSESGNERRFTKYASRVFSILLWNHNERALACQGRLGQFLVTSQEAALARVAVVLSPVLFVWSLWFVWFVWFVSFVWLNEAN